MSPLRTLGVDTSMPIGQVAGDLRPYTCCRRPARWRSRPALGRFARRDVDELERVPAERRGRSGLERQRRRPGVAVRRRQRDGDDDDADVHDHASVGAPDQPAPALPAGGEDDLAQRRPGGEPGRGRSRAAAPIPRPRRRRRQRGRSRRTPPARTAAREQLAARLAPRQHRGDRHQEQQHQPDRRRQPVEVRTADVDLAVLQHLDEAAGTRCRAGRRRRTRRTARCWRGTPPRATPESRSCPAIAARSPRQPIRASDSDDDDAEERQQIGTDRAVAEGVDARQHARSG